MGAVHLLAGTDSRPITPTIVPDRPVYLAGFGQNRRAPGIHDDLFVRTLALRLGNTTVALAVCDLYPDDPFNHGDHYEEKMSIRPEIGPLLMDALLGLLRDRELTN